MYVSTLYSDTTTKDNPTVLSACNNEYFKSRPRILEHPNAVYMKPDMMRGDDLNPTDDYVTLSTRKVRWGVGEKGGEVARS